MSTEYLPVSWSDFHTLTQKLATFILDRQKPKPETIVAIGRGGMSVGLMLSDFLNLPICSITIQSYTDIKKQGELKVTEKLGKTIRNKHILLVDDNADSGKTFLRAIKYLKPYHPSSITTASVFYKPWSTYLPDYIAQHTEKWILFPHEVTEWIATFTKKMQKEGSSLSEIRNFLQSLGYTDDQIIFVQTHYT